MHMFRAYLRKSSGRITNALTDIAKELFSMPYPIGARAGRVSVPKPMCPIDEAKDSEFDDIICNRPKKLYLQEEDRIVRVHGWCGSQILHRLREEVSQW